MSSSDYRTLLGAPGAAAFFLTAAAGRVGIAMTSLGIVWLVHARTGSYATAGLVTGCLPLPVAGSPIELGFTIALTGLAIPLILILCSVLAESAVHQTVLTQAFAWLNSASAAGSAGAAAVAGWAVDGRGAPGGFAAAAVAAALMAMLAVTGQRALRVPHRQAAATQSAE